jgi:flagellar motor switch protein FliM
MIKTKDIKFRPAIGRWYEYRQAKKYNTSFVFKNIDSQVVNDILTMHYQYGATLAELFKAKLSLAVELYEVIIQQEKYSEFLEEHKGFYFTYAVPSSIVPELQFVLDYPLAQAVINRAAGGGGQYLNTDQKLSALEEVILHALFEEILTSYQKLWQDVTQLNEKGSVPYSPQLKLNERIKKADEVVSLTIMLALGEQLPAAVTILFSNQDFEKLVEIYQDEIAKRPRKMTVKLLPQSVSDVIVPVDVNIGTTTVSISDVIGLRTGDVFQLNERLSDSVMLKIGPNAEFYGKLGRIGEKTAIQIVDLKGKYYQLQEDTQLEETTEEALERPEIKKIEEPEQEEIQEDNDQEEAVLNEELEKEFEAETSDSLGSETARTAVANDPLLKEFEHEKEDDNSEFVWDIDDL